MQKQTKKKYGVTRSLITKGNRKGFGFTFEWTKALTEADKYDGYQVFVTTEFDLSEKDVIESYRTRDQIEKAIRTLKSVLGLHPQYVRTKKHVLGNIFVCAAAFQLRSMLGMRLKDEGIQVLRKLTDLDSETRTLVEVFKLFFRRGIQGFSIFF